MSGNISTMKTLASEAEIEAYKRIVELLENCPVPREERLANLSLFLTRSSIARIIYFDFLYRKILPISGVVMEFGVRWGRDLSVLLALRTAYEPHNFSRRIIGFDTFEGFPSVSKHDGTAERGRLGVSDRYVEYLEDLIEQHERLAPRPALKRSELVVGDAMQTLPLYLEEHPETVVALAYFDMDLYDPTDECLNALRPHLTRGSIVAFDEIGLSEYPGETRAARDAGWLRRHSLQRFSLMGFEAYTVVE